MKKQLLLISILITLVYVTGCAPTVKKTQVHQLVKSTKTWDGSTLPNYPKGTPEITILRILIPPKTDLPMHYHPVINAGVLLKGELTVITETNEKLHLKAGDALVELVGKMHYGRNTGSTDAEIIVFYAAEKGEKITVKK